MAKGCACGANCQPRRLPKWVMVQISEGRLGLLGVAGFGTDGFCCPLCARLLPITCATVAHAPSKEVGGTAQTFLCKACNDFLGTSYEASADTYITAMREESGSGARTRKITLTNREGTRVYMDGAFSTKDGAHRLEGQPRGRNKAAEQRFAAQRGKDDSLKVSYRVPSDK